MREGEDWEGDAALRTCPPAGIEEMGRVYNANRKNQKVRIKEDRLLMNQKISVMIFTCIFVLSNW